MSRSETQKYCAKKSIQKTHLDLFRSLILEIMNV